MAIQTGPLSREEETRKCNSIIIPYIAGTSEKLSRIFNKHHILVHFKPTKLVHPKNKTPRHKQGNVDDAVAARTAQICTMERQNNLSINEWPNTGGPAPQVKTLLSTYILRRKTSKHLILYPVRRTGRDPAGLVES